MKLLLLYFNGQFLVFWSSDFDSSFLFNFYVQILRTIVFLIIYGRRKFEVFVYFFVICIVQHYAMQCNISVHSRSLSLIQSEYSYDSELHSHQKPYVSFTPSSMLVHFLFFKIETVIWNLHKLILKSTKNVQYCSARQNMNSKLQLHIINNWYSKIYQQFRFSFRIVCPARAVVYRVVLVFCFLLWWLQDLFRKLMQIIYY